MTIPGVRSSVEDDVYVLLVSWEPVGVDGATFKIYVNPLVNFLWTGGLVFIVGMLVAAWPSAAEGRRATTMQVAASARAPAGD
jgi:cytochrome c-type biogenesis protein CcmF